MGVLRSYNIKAQKTTTNGLHDWPMRALPLFF